MVSKARLVITAVVVEGRPVAEVAAAYGVHRAWVYKLLARYRAEGEAAFDPRSRRPHSSPSATSNEVVDLVLRLRKELTGQGSGRRPAHDLLDTFTEHHNQHRPHRSSPHHATPATAYQARTHVLLLVQDLDIRVINAATGELLRELTLNPAKDYQPQTQPTKRNRPNP